MVSKAAMNSLAGTFTSTISLSWYHSQFVSSTRENSTFLLRKKSLIHILIKVLRDTHSSWASCCALIFFWSGILAVIVAIVIHMITKVLQVYTYVLQMQIYLLDISISSNYPDSFHSSTLIWFFRASSDSSGIISTGLPHPSHFLSLFPLLHLSHQFWVLHLIRSWVWGR